MANRRLVARAPRRSKVWLAFNSSLITGLLPSTSVMQTIQTDTSMIVFGRPTLARIRGSAIVMIDTSATTAGAKGTVAMGIATVPANQVIGFPQPLTEADYGWIWWHISHLGKPDAGTEENVLSVDRFEVDSKAMRKLPVGTKLVLVAEAGPALAGTVVFEAALGIRFLEMPS